MSARRRRRRRIAREKSALYSVPRARREEMYPYCRYDTFARTVQRWRRCPPPSPNPRSPTPPTPPPPPRAVALLAPQPLRNMAAFLQRAPDNLDEPMSDARSDGNSTIPDDDFIHVSPSAFQPWRAEINRLALELTAQHPVLKRTETERNHNREVARITCNYQLIWLNDCVVDVEKSLPTGDVSNAPAQDFFNALYILGPAQFIKWSHEVPKPLANHVPPPEALLNDLGMINTRNTVKRAIDQQDEHLLENAVKQLILLKEVLRESPAPTLLSSLTPATARVLYEHLRSRLDELPTLLPQI
ncbi:mucin-2 [Gracilaria domingensis]|nr:mucin-2 [Gracilaria domingensis]